MNASSDIGGGNIPIAGADSCAAAPVVGPPTLGLVLWLKGDAGLETTIDPDAGLVVTTWRDQSGFGQDVQDNLPINPGPFAGLDTVDGVPCATWALNGGFGANALRGLFRLAGVRDRNGDLFGYGVGERQPRTISALLVPRFSAAVFNITGGIVCEMGSTPAWQPLFDLETNFGNPQGFYLFSAGAWRGAANAGPDTTGGAGGTYDGVPLLAVWTSGGFPDLECSVGGSDVMLTPTDIPGAPGPTINHAFTLGRQSSGGFNFFGAIPEFMIHDYDLTTDAAAWAQLFSYYGGRYPTALT